MEDAEANGSSADAPWAAEYRCIINYVRRLERKIEALKS